MTELKNFVALQARLYEFLAQQDETTLRAIADGTVQLTVSGADGERAPVPRAATPANKPLQVANDLSSLSSEEERRTYLNNARLQVSELRKVANSLGLRRYSSLNRAKLIDFIVRDGTSAEDEPLPPPSQPVNQNVDVAAVAARLRETETEEEGTAYLREQHLDRESLLAVATELQLTRVNRLSQAELEKRVIKQAIGARRKFAGLRQW